MSKLRRTLAPLSAVACLLSVAIAADAQVANWKEIRIPPLHSFKIERPRRVELPNGAILMLQEDHELPLISGTALFHGGSRREPSSKAGLVDLFGEVWRTGGTASKTGDQLDDFLESRAAKVETGGDIDSIAISFDVLKQDFDPVLAVFSDLMRNPEFREDKIEIARKQITTGISRRNDDPMEIASREGVKLAYGPDSPYARTTEYYTVAEVTRDDLMAWHRTYVQPNNMILGIVGDFDSARMEAKIRNAFGGWKAGPPIPKFQSEFPKTRAGVYFAPKDDINQSSIRMVALGTRKDNPDYYALQVLNEVLGGGFSSRLFSNVRSKKGLAYAVGGGIGTAFDHPGIFILSVGTKSETTIAAIDALNEELDNLFTHPPTQEELQRAKDSILNSFIFRFDSKKKLLREQMALTFYEYPSDFFDRFRAGVEKVTAADLERVAKKYVHKNEMAILVVGKAADFDRPLSSLGEVTTLDISIPESAPGTSPGATSSAGDPKGRALAQTIIDAMGGEKRLAEIKAIRQKAKVVAKTDQGEMPLTIESIDVYPSSTWQKISTPMGEMTLVVSPESAFMAMAGGSRDLPSSEKEERLKEMKIDPVYVLQHASDDDVTFSAAGAAKIENVNAEIVDVRSKGETVRWWVDPETGRILRTESKAMTPSGPGRQTVDFSDWRVVDGLPVAFARAITLDGAPGGSVTMEEYQVNPPVDPGLFSKPGSR